MAFLYSPHVKDLYWRGLSAVIISGSGEIDAWGGGAPKHTTDILALHELTIALCLTLTSLPFVMAFSETTQKNTGLVS